MSPAMAARLTDTLWDIGDIVKLIEGGKLVMPKSIVLFERVAYLNIVLGLASVTINWPLIAKRHGAAFFVLTVLISIGIEVFLMRRTARRRNWARWTFIALIFVGTAMAIAEEILRPTPHNGVVGNAAFYLDYLTGVAAAYFLLTSESWTWFRLSSDEARDPVDIRLQP